MFRLVLLFTQNRTEQNSTGQDRTHIRIIQRIFYESGEHDPCMIKHLQTIV